MAINLEPRQTPWSRTQRVFLALLFLCRMVLLFLLWLTWPRVYLALVVVLAIVVCLSHR